MEWRIERTSEIEKEWVEIVNDFFACTNPSPLEAVALADYATEQGVSAEIEILKLDIQYGDRTAKHKASSNLELLEKHLNKIKIAIGRKKKTPTYRMARKRLAPELYDTVFEHVRAHIPRPPMAERLLDRAPSEYQLARTNLTTADIINRAIRNEFRMN